MAHGRNPWCRQGPASSGRVWSSGTVEIGLVLAIAFALSFALTNGFHDASNAIATLVATRGATPGQAIILSSVFNMIGAILLGTAVADTIASIVTVDSQQAVAVVGSGVAAATAWNLLTWRVGLPSSSGHALVGGLVGASLLAAGAASVHWGGMDGFHPVGVLGALVALFASPPLGFLVGFLLIRAFRLGSRRGTRRWDRPVVDAQWVTAATLSAGHGANDAQKSMGVIASLLLAAGVTDELDVPLWVKAATGIALTLGTALGGWRIVATVGRRIYGLAPLDSLASQTSSTAVILSASFLGAPVSTTQVVASSVVGIGTGRRRWHHVGWVTVRDMAVAWVVTIPAAGLLAAGILLAWKGLSG